jgi:FtsH-binding integral membrane protein
MNKAQKQACFNIAYSLLGIALGICTFMHIKNAGFNQATIWAYLNRVWLLLFLIIPPLSYIYLRKKQSQSEVDFDERDRAIRIKAKAFSFFALWATLFVLMFFTMFYLGKDGSIAVFILPLVFCGLAIVCTLTYSLAILYQYKSGGKNGSK